MSSPRGFSTMLNTNVNKISNSTNATATPSRRPRAGLLGAEMGRGVTHATRRDAVYRASTSSADTPKERAYDFRKPRTNTSPGSSSKRSVSMRSMLAIGMRVTRDTSSTLILRSSRNSRRYWPTVGIGGTPRLLELLQHGAAFFPDDRLSRELCAVLEVAPGGVLIAHPELDTRTRSNGILEGVTAGRLRFQCPRKR